MPSKIPPLKEIIYLHSDGVPTKEFADGFLFTSARGRFFVDFVDYKKILYEIYKNKNEITKEKFRFVRSHLRLVFFQPFLYDNNLNFEGGVSAFANIEYDGKYNVSSMFSLSHEDFIELATNYKPLFDWYLWNPFKISL